MARKSSKNSPVNRVLLWLNEPTDYASLTVVRVVFGLLMTALSLRLAVTGATERLYLAQSIHFKYPFLGWVPDPSPGLMYTLLGVVGIAGLLFAVGLVYRAAAVALCLAWSYIFLCDQTPYQNHDYLICLLSLFFVFMPLNRAYSIDARIRPSLRRDTVPAWCLYFFRFQIGLVYFYGGVWKLNPDWLRGEPIQSMLHTEAFEHPIVGAWFFNEALVMGFAYGGLLLDLFIVPALLWRVTRWPAFLISLGFHLTNAWLWDIDIFPWFMIAATLTFFPPYYPRRWWAVLRRRPTPSAVEEKPLSKPGRLHGLWAGVLLVYALIQLLVPLRPFLYPGHPLAQKDLLIFSWDMMLRLDATQVVFIVKNKSSGETREVLPEEVLSPFQLGRMGWPDVVHQTAQHIASQEGPGVAVHVRSRTRVNARSWQMAYDPEVDLAATPRIIGAKPWVMPLMNRYPPDPSERTAFYRAKWEFCRAQGFLPFLKGTSDPDAAAHVAAWTEAYHQERLR